jgi:hypothetical protein
MSNTYTLHQTIHELLPQLNQKYGLKLEVESDTVIFMTDVVEETKINYNENYISDTGSLMTLDRTGACIATTITDDWCFKIQAPQIRQILLGLQNLLGLQIYEFEQNNLCFAEDGNGKVLQPLIDREPDQVLQELIEIIKELLK